MHHIQQALVLALARAHRWSRMLERGEVASVTCGFAFPNIQPQLFWEGLEAQRQQALRLDNFDRNHDLAMKRFAKYFHALNLKAVPGTSYFAIYFDYVVPEI